MGDVAVVIRMEVPAISVLAGVDLDLGKIGIDDFDLMIALGAKLVHNLACVVHSVNVAVGLL